MSPRYLETVLAHACDLLDLSGLASGVCMVLQSE